MIISRTFFNPVTKDYLHIEAHEVKNNAEIGKDGDFVTAFWINEGENGGCEGFDGDIHLVVRAIQEYVPDNGMIEMPIPKDCYC